jgi:hypothetical protein
LGDDTDWAKYYDDETYLLDWVGKNFRETGKLAAPDFYMILIWKEERAKNRHKARLKRISGASFEAAVQNIASELYTIPDRKPRLELLMNRWWFLLPTATAILTILYPDEFTVYDWRVCDELKCDYEPWCSRTFSDALWDHYAEFEKSVSEAVPSQIRLRDKDRFLIGRSNRKSIENDCKD